MGISSFEDRLSNARKEKGFTQEEFAIRLGVTPQAVSKWERGLGYPDLELLYYICEVLGCSADYLLHTEFSKVRLTESDDEIQKKKLLSDILAEPLELVIGTALIDFVKEENSKCFPSIKALREKLALQKGVLFPVLRIRDDITISEHEFRIMAYGRILYVGTVDKDMTFQDICDCLEKVTIDNYDEILNRQMVQTLVDNAADKYPAAVKGVIPDKVSLALLQSILSALILRKKPIRNLIKIIEVLEEEAGGSGSINDMTDILIDRLNL